MKPFIPKVAFIACITFGHLAIACAFCKSQPSSKPTSMPTTVESTTSSNNNAPVATAPLGKTIASMDSSNSFFSSSFGTNRKSQETRREMKDNYSVGNIYQND